MSFIGVNLKNLRRNEGWTQEELAIRLGIKRSLVGAYEEQRAEPKADLLVRMANLFSITLEQLIAIPLDPKTTDRSGGIDLQGKKIRVLTIKTDTDNEELIQYVPAKAAAGYLNGYADPEFVDKLPAYRIPELSSVSCRAFEITGDSMLPIPSGSIIFAEYVSDMLSLKDGTACIVISSRDGIVFKRVFNRFPEKNYLLLRSDNPIYPEYEIPLKEVVEIWKFRAFLATESQGQEDSVRELSRIVMQLQRSVQELKERNYQES